MMAYGKDYEVRANLDAQNAGNCISGLQISNIFWGVCPQTPLGIHAWYVGHMAIPHYHILSHRKVPFQKMLRPPSNGKLLKKGPDKISNKVVYVYCVSKAVGQTNTVPPPPPNKIRPVRPCGSLSPTICSNRRSRTSEGPLS
jgi:hypothetical protein